MILPSTGHENNTAYLKAEKCFLNRGDLNFCIRSAPLPKTGTGLSEEVKSHDHSFEVSAKISQVYLSSFRSIPATENSGEMWVARKWARNLGVYSTMK